MSMRFLLSFIYIISAGSLYAQEYLYPPADNPAIRIFSRHNGVSSFRTSGLSDTLHLPFYDDFSSSGIYPSVLRWQDNKVFINSNLGRNMPTVGVATFDGLDELGNAYVAGSSTPGQADVLTSLPLHLFTKPGGGNYVLTDSIYISFFYEKKGYGDAPDATDSLVLECYKPSLQTWNREWYVNGGVSSGQDTVFTRVDVLLSSADYLADGFMFRFRNYGNLSGALDHWHIDYVRVFSLTATSFNFIDQAFAGPRPSIISGYTSVPWQHYKAYATPADLITDSSTVKYIIHHSNANENAGFAHEAFSFDGDPVGSFTVGTNVYPTNQFLQIAYPVNYILPATEEFSPDSTWFDLTDHFTLQLNADPILSNDTIHFRQYLYNYYSYDDGSCEAGYDLVNAAGGKVAMRFDALQPDYIYGVQIYFARQNADVSNKLINLKVWSSLSPETVLLQLFNLTPRYVDSLNGFATYYFGSPVAVGTQYYLGFQQVDPDGLHLGFDKNTASNSRMYYNVSGTWSTVSVLPGTFMIRPLVGNITVDVPEHQNSRSFSFYPNPASDNLYIKSGIEGNAFTIIRDTEGRTVLHCRSSNVVDLSALRPGLYTIEIMDETTKPGPQKLVISR